MRKIKLRSLPARLDIGCGNNRIDGFVGIDKIDFGQEIVWDVTQGIPVEDGTISQIHTSHFLEHIKNEDLKDLFDEFFRVCVDGALLTLIVPHQDTDEAHYLCHYSFWSESKFNGICKDSFGRMTLEKTSRDGINLTANIRINK